MGIGIKAIGSALKAIRSLGKAKTDHPAPREVVAIPQRNFNLHTRSEHKKYIVYKEKYGQARDEKDVLDEFGAILETLDLAKKEGPNLWVKLFDLESKFSGELKDQLIEARRSASQNGVQQFIKKLQLRMDAKQEPELSIPPLKPRIQDTSPVLANLFDVESHVEMLQDGKSSAEFTHYKAHYGGERNTPLVLEEFVAITKIIAFFKDDTNMWTDVQFGNMLIQLPNTVQTAFRTHMRKVSGYNDTHPPKLNSEHVKFFKGIIGAKQVRFVESSHKMRLMSYGEAKGFHTVMTSAHKANSDVLTNGDTQAIQKIAAIPKEDIERFVSFRDAYRVNASQNEMSIEQVIEQFSTLLRIIESLRDQRLIFDNAPKKFADLPEDFRNDLWFFANCNDSISKKNLEVFLDKLGEEGFLKKLNS